MKFSWVVLDHVVPEVRSKRLALPDWECDYDGDVLTARGNGTVLVFPWSRVLEACPVPSPAVKAKR